MYKVSINDKLEKLYIDIEDRYTCNGGIVRIHNEPKGYGNSGFCKLVKNDNSYIITNHTNNKWNKIDDKFLNIILSKDTVENITGECCGYSWLERSKHYKVELKSGEVLYFIFEFLD